MRFDERWIGQEQLDALCALAVRTNDLVGEVVEIGTWQGLSAVPLCRAIVPSVLHVVDHWLGDGPEAAAAGLGIAPDLVARDNYGIFLSNMLEGTAGNFKVHKQDWREWVVSWTAPVRFLHLDATHLESEVSDCLAAVRSFAVHGAILAGDDWDWPTVARGVQRQFSDVHLGAGKLWWVECP